MAISKASVEYYNLEKVAEVLSVSTAEVNRLREQSKLRGFRDGTNWKFQKDDVHAYLAESIKARSGSANGQQAADSGFDLGNGIASESSFDLMEDAALPDDDQLVSVAQPKSDVDLAALEQDSDLALAEESHIPMLTEPKKEFESSVMPEKSEASSALILASGQDEDSLVGVSDGSSSQLGLAEASGFDILVAGEEENMLEVDDENTESVSSMVEFELEPTPEVQDNNDADSSSQVIAIDMEGLTEAQNADPFGQDHFGDFAGFDSGISAPAAASAASHPVGAGASPFDFTASAPTVSTKKVTAEEEYSTGMLSALGAALVIMLLPCIMLIDTMIHMWSWNDHVTLTSGLMSMIAGWFGL